MTFMIACLATTLPVSAFAASATIDFGFGQAPAALMSAPSPANVQTNPMFVIVQTGTEADTAASPATGAPQETKASVGIDSYLNADFKSYNVPLSYTISPDLYAQAILPVMTIKGDDAAGFAGGTGIGDTVLTAKHRYAGADTFELYSVLAAKLATGSTDKGLGTGSHDLSITEKYIRRFGDYRATFMAGVTLPMNDPSLAGSKVQYGRSLVYMAAAERSYIRTDLWFSLRAAGVLVSESKVDGVGLGNSLHTLQLIPEVKFYSPLAPLRFAVIVPLVTAYDVPDASKNPITVNFGVSKAF